MSIPILVPLGNGSRFGNDELRILLRSIDRNVVDAGTVYLMTEHCPEWVDNVVVVPLGDPYTSNKDANLHYKTLTTIERHGIGRFCWCADDNVFMRPMRLEGMPVVHNHRSYKYFCENNPESRWRARIRNTFEWAVSRGVFLEHNFEGHVPQLFDGQALVKGMHGVDYTTQPGLTIYTTWRVVTDTWHESVDQNEVKTTVETNFIDYKFDKPFLGYNDLGFGSGLREKLLAMFPERSRFEKEEK